MALTNFWVKPRGNPDDRLSSTQELWWPGTELKSSNVNEMCNLLITIVIASPEWPGLPGLMHAESYALLCTRTGGFLGINTDKTHRLRKNRPGNVFGGGRLLAAE